MRIPFVAALSLLIVPAAAAQVSMRGQGMLRGFAHDSLSRTPLVGAAVRVSGTQLRTVTDGAGYFRFDALLEGPYLLVLSHTGLDSAGWDSLTAPVTIETGRVATALLATPSLKTIWSRHCSAVQAVAADSGVLMGTVTAVPTGNRVVGAAVVATWLAAEPRSITVRSDSLGSYCACGVSRDVAVQVQAYWAGDSNGAMPIRLGLRPVARRDLSIGTAGPRTR